ncbi:4-(cytidine 5'-diphospho)-2-C-methyl-D-erythritol kinase [Planctomicrobium piriforme]|uniref:4-(cytidine 5'-diphospho)-2-C-methyl-D-erythritol kinase n=1 Tax=Planctomicrobium piriforme TaxID=1576369 RepID=UPI0015870F09|nr:4-(cytidine 5'-diphospho)-2-C-methyl-D-erythritol kinase [Planctomicrobium piriforme]
MRLSRQGQTLSVLAPAKLNLSLTVLGRRPDGYHNLETVMLSVRLYDSLQFSQAESNSIELDCRNRCRPRLPLANDERNLVIRAARLLQAETGCTRGVKISLTKRIPMEAGLGGGSSDAAATLVALNQFWELGLSQAQLHSLAAQLGSDVNFFLDSAPAAFCTGRGEAIEPVPVAQPLHFMIVKPPFGLSTGKVFQQWWIDRSTSRIEQQAALRALARGDVRRVGQAIINDLQRPAQSLNGQLDEVLNELAKADVPGYGMTGSGSACFALCRDARQAAVLAGRWRQRGLGQVFAVSSGV